MRSVLVSAVLGLVRLLAATWRLEVHGDTNVRRLRDAGVPLVFTVFFAFFPAGLVLYWVVNNTLSIAQQYVITKRVEQGAS